jgi:dTDP-4-dehydrorhamnose 3,5-epimerase-like enzyme
LAKFICSSRVDGARLIELPCHRRDNGAVVVAQTSAAVPFEIARVFTISAPVHAKRGEHAHRLCSQLMLCVSGAVEVVCDDGSDKKMFSLDHGDLALLVPPTIWNTVTFREQNSVLIVLCDRPYEEHDYIRDYSAFLAARKAMQS